MDRRTAVSDNLSDKRSTDDDNMSIMSDCTKTSHPSKRRRLLCVPETWRIEAWNIDAWKTEAWKIFTTFILCAAFQLLIWGLREILRPVSLQFFAPILGMILVFLAMISLGLLVESTQTLYEARIKENIDFLNRHLGIGFPIPLVMINEEEPLDARGIGQVMGAFALTNVVFWALTFVIAGTMQVLVAGNHQGFFFSKAEQGEDPESYPRSAQHAAVMSERRHFRLQTAQAPHNVAHTTVCPPHFSESTLQTPETATPAPQCSTTWSTPQATQVSLKDLSSVVPKDFVSPSPLDSETLAADQLAHSQTSAADHLVTSRTRPLPAYWPLALSAICILLVGFPLAAASGEDRILDGCLLWFSWITSVRLQQWLHHVSGRSHDDRLKTGVTAALATLLNPVLATSLLMLAFTQIKTRARPDTSLDDTLNIFSSGTPLSAILSYHAFGSARPLPPGRQDWYGAGDAALGILECGIVAWGFKLYECRHQIRSRAGGATVVASAVAAAASAFLSVVVANRAVGLRGPEALAFAARSTTLALAKPAMEALGGNKMVNAAVVVCNGILGQFVYPHVPNLLDIPRHAEAVAVADTDTDTDTDADADTGANRRQQPGRCEHQRGGDRPLTAAAGATVGINGAAMGVAYLYNHRSRAAPYSVVAMTVFGVLTVVFTCVDPFSKALQTLAG